jgi:predicted RecB family nuclease
MKLINGQLLYSPSDLITFLESPFASWMDRYHLEVPGAVEPDELTASEKLVANAGTTHEANFLKQQYRDGRTITEIPTASGTAKAEKLTAKALQSDIDIIFQARLHGERFAGWADFIVRSHDNRDEWEIWDTKLARKMKGTFLLQLCAYAEILEEMTGRRPKVVRAVLGDGTIHAHRTEDFFDYYLETKERFLAFMEAWTPDISQRPVPEPSAEHRRWSSHAEAWLLENDHLSLVARISKGQRVRLEAAGIHTLTDLATACSIRRPGKIPEKAFLAMQEQAALQKSTREKRAKDPDAPADFRVMAPEADRQDLGLGGLPPAHPADLFFDLEGYPLVENGLEYLWGVTYRDNGRQRFRDWWAHDPKEERIAFERFVDWAHARWITYPDLHIYHYANYEIAVLKRLMSRYGSREEKVDDLLRNSVFVDLYKVVREGLRIGEPSYSIKYIERLYRPRRTNEVATAGESVVQYGNWMESGQGREPASSPILKEIRDYNKDDCDSTLELAEWLRLLQSKAGIRYTKNTQNEPVTSEESPKAIGDVALRLDQIDGLDYAAINTTDPIESKLAKTLRDFVGFFPRDNKPIWWRWFDRLQSTDEQLFEDIACIGGSTLLAPEGQAEKGSLIFDYAFDSTQDTKLRSGNKVAPTANRFARLSVESIDTTKGFFQVKLSKKSFHEKLNGRMPEVTSWIPDEFVPPGVLETSLNTQINAYLDTGYLHKPIRQFLLRQPPPSLDTTMASSLQRSLLTTLRMDGELLCIQGPPGTGKSTTAAAVVLSLIEAGHSVGLCSGAHKAIQNLLAKVSAKSKGTIGMIYKGSSNEEDEPDIPGLVVAKSNDGLFDYRLSGIIAGTPWLFARDEAVGKLDFLFVDEAGQMSTAHLIAMGRCARNIILLGDQMQLEQVSNAIHPNSAGHSSLEYYLDGARVIPRQKGIFLPVSYRMQPDLCRIVSEIAYEGELHAKGTGGRHLKWPQPQTALPRDRGLCFVPVPHEGNIQASEEEANTIASLTNSLLTATLHGIGNPRRLAIEDVLFVAPYNMQVNLLRQTLPEGARVASVDKFQGQEAAVVILSMCGSFGEYGSRGIEFILNRNRLNVALSRAQVLAIMVGDPRIASTATQSIKRMAEISTFAKIKRW